MYCNASFQIVNGPGVKSFYGFRADQRDFRISVPILWLSKDEDMMRSCFSFNPTMAYHLRACRAMLISGVVLGPVQWQDAGYLSVIIAPSLEGFRLPLSARPSSAPVKRDVHNPNTRNRGCASATVPWRNPARTQPVRTKCLRISYVHTKHQSLPNFKQDKSSAREPIDNQQVKLPAPTIVFTEQNRTNPTKFQPLRNRIYTHRRN